MEIKKIAVVGAGQMGAGIAQVALVSGIEVDLYDLGSSTLDSAYRSIRSRIEKKHKYDGSETVEQIMSRLRVTTDKSEFQNVQVVIEAAPEQQQLKQKIFSELGEQFPAGVILATNTSSLSITAIAAVTRFPERVIGLHFMNPVPVMKLVEVIRGLQTNEEVYKVSLGLVQQLGKLSVTAKLDMPGFVVNRILLPLINEAIFALMEGLASAEEIDQAMRLGANHPMGPLELADFIGLDTCLAVLQILHRELGDDKFRPCPLLTKYVEAGWYGKKSGRGFYQY